VAFLRRLTPLLLALTVPARGEDARDLLRQSEDRHRSRSQEYSGELTVTSKAGKVRRKGWKSWREGYAGDARQLIRFLDPPEVRGVGFLSLSRKGKTPDQWLYLPSMKRERRIAAQDRDSSFVGTDFNYEDLEELDHEKYDVRIDGEETEGGSPCWVIEAVPRERSVYARKRIWLGKADLFLRRVDSFRKGEREPAKRLVLGDLQVVDGHLAAKRMEMSDLEKGSRTVVLLQQLAFDRPESPGRFTLQNLNREAGE
jgi:outer membrane lipoprotein-sorting protein